LSINPLIRYIQQKYGEIYALWYTIAWKEARLAIA
jgi:hypothetical protein